MTATVIAFPTVAPCPHCFERIRTVALDRHLGECPVRLAKLAHPSTRGGAS